MENMDVIWLMYSDILSELFVGSISYMKTLYPIWLYENPIYSKWIEWYQQMMFLEVNHHL